MEFVLSSSSAYLQLSSNPKFTHNFSLAYTNNPSCAPKKMTPIISCVSTRTRRKSGSASPTRIPSSEAVELVAQMMNSFTDKKPLVATLNKYVKMVRTEHCFLLFEELGKSDNWLQCLEVRSHPTLLYRYVIEMNI